MIKKLNIAILLLTFISCDNVDKGDGIQSLNLESRMIKSPLNDTLLKGSSYLSVYSNIYSKTEHRLHDLTATVSMRNTNRKDTIFIEKAEFFATNGQLIKTYIDKTIFITPLETVEIVINDVNGNGGTGANFIFDWSMKPNSNEPIFESVMISTSGQQGISFSTQGKRLK